MDPRSTCVMSGGWVGGDETLEESGRKAHGVM